MSISRVEFDRGIKRLGGHLVSESESTATFQVLCEGGAADISFTPTQGVTLGTSLALPRANVTIMPNTQTPDQAIAFFNNFDQVFQRGGG